METAPDYSFQRYLSAKKSADDRALNRVVWQALFDFVQGLDEEQPLQVLEVGGGSGAMVERMLEWELFGSADYTLLDLSPENIAFARRKLPAWAQARGWRANWLEGDVLRLDGGGAAGERLHLSFETADLFDFAARPSTRPAPQLLVAHAVLDLLDVPAALQALFTLLCPDGRFYFSLNFDGETVFEPTLDPSFDGEVIRLYHRTMDERVAGGRPSGDSRTGRHLFERLRQAGAQVLASGSSDWVVFAGPTGYPADEAYFLHFLLHTLHTALQGHPELPEPQLSDWIAARHAQIERDELVYIAHQLDFFGQINPAGG